MKCRTTVYFFFERDGESSSFHSYLSHSLRKPTKDILHASAFRKLLLNGLFRSDEMLAVAEARFRKLHLAALRLRVSPYKLVLFY